jgi:3',5'-cyclic AMP phosphodiesterase CpdA
VKIYHISDLHIHKRAKDNKTVTAKLAQLRQSWNPHQDIVVCTGDITDDGSEAQYNHALNLLVPFIGRLILAPGNHDYGYLGNFYTKRAVRRFKALKQALRAQTIMSSGKYVFLTLDTCLRTGGIVDFAQGKVGLWQRRLVKKFIKQCKKSNVKSVICMHHTPFETAWWTHLQDAKKFINLVLGQADIVLVGHEHKEREVNYPDPRGCDKKTTTHMHSAGALYREGTKICVVEGRIENAS